ncbi:MAG: methyltransferase domain-containing protein [Spirochaetaceae bacterium]
MIYFVPEVAVGHGLGHVHRDSLVSARLSRSSCVVVPPGADTAAREHRARIRKHVTSLGGTVIDAIPHDAEGTIVIDRRTVSSEEIRSLPPGCTVVGIDAAGPGRELLDAVVDALPGPAAAAGANAAGVFLPALPGNRRDALPEVPKRILLTFGGEDAAGLTEAVLQGLLRRGLTSREAVAVAQGPLNGRIPTGAGEVLRAPRNLPELLARYDLVIASYGLTAFEALAAGCRVILVNPSTYHEALSRRAGLPSAGAARPGGGRLRWRQLAGWLTEPGALDRALAGAVRPSGRELASVLREYAAADALGCPVCRRRWNPAIARLSRRSYFRCGRCGMVYLEGFDRDDTDYTEEYFFEEYRAQYGRTYLEDFDHIAAMGRRRLAAIDRLLPSRPVGPTPVEESASALGGGGGGAGGGDGGGAATGRDVRAPALLDVGCAYGPFLHAAAGRGYAPVGIDPAEGAVEYVRSTLGYPAVVARAGRADPAELFGRQRFDAVTMWYVIEHLDDLERVLRWVAGLLPAGGVFAFSTPNGAGVSARRDLLRFLTRSPRDHRSVWTPASARKVLRRFGFRLRIVRITGHHPERYRLGEKLPWVRPLLLQWSRLRGRGDTFEVYAVRGTG